MIAVPIGPSGQSLVFADNVLAHFKRHQQVRWWQCEAGGQLFARVKNDRIEVVEATGPRRTDRRSRTSYKPDHHAEQREIDERFPLGLHFVGDWHTHPEDQPKPSLIDVQSTADSVRRSRHTLHAFVLVIVGRGAFPAALQVSVHDGEALYLLRASEI